MIAMRSTFASNIPLSDGYVDIPLEARTVGNLILKSGGPVNFSWLTPDGDVTREYFGITFNSSINAGLDRNADVRVSFAYRAELATSTPGTGIDYAFYNGDSILARGALYTRDRLGASNWPKHECHTRHDVAVPPLLVPRAIFLQTDRFRFILNTDQFTVC